VVVVDSDVVVVGERVVADGSSRVVIDSSDAAPKPGRAVVDVPIPAVAVVVEPAAG
jgi:hypothetical protein